MADQKITELTSVGSVIAIQVLPIVDDPSGTPTTKKATVTQLSTFLAAETKAITNKTSYNKVALTAPATGSTLTIADGKTLTASNTLTLTGTDAASVNFGAGGTVAYGATTAVDTIGLTVDGGGSAITTGFKGFVQVPFACTINSWTLLSTDASVTSGSIVVDIWKDTYAAFPPVVGDTITASAKPTITTATKATSSTLTGWTTSIAAGDILGFNVDSVTSLLRVTLMLKVTKS